MKTRVIPHNVTTDDCFIFTFLPFIHTKLRNNPIMILSKMIAFLGSLANECKKRANSLIFGGTIGVIPRLTERKY
jgi:hypothetical protein